MLSDLSVALAKLFRGALLGLSLQTVRFLATGFLWAFLATHRFLLPSSIRFDSLYYSSTDDSSALISASSGRSDAGIFFIFLSKPAGSGIFSFAKRSIA